MVRLWALAAAMLVTGYAAHCEAQCWDGLEGRLVDLSHGDADGFFVTTADMECLSIRLGTIPMYEAVAANYRARAHESEARWSDSSKAAAEATASLAGFADGYRALQGEVTALTAELGAWYRSVATWLVISGVAALSGFAVGALAL
jgi:hypothetical protein